MWHVVGCWMCLYDYVDYDYNYKGHFYTIANDFYNYTMYMICGKFDMDVWHYVIMSNRIWWLGQLMPIVFLVLFNMF